MTIDFSFAIVNWNTRDLLHACLTSIYAVKGDFSIEILVADNASSDGSAEMVRRDFPEVILVETGANLGFARGQQPLFERSNGRFHVLVNSDVVLQPGCLEPMASRMESDPQIGVLGCRLVDELGAVQAGCRRFPSLWFQFQEALGINRFFPTHPRLNAYKMGDFDHLSSREVDQVMGSLFLIRRELIHTIGRLDTAFFMYYEEVDYCKRCRDAGYKVFYEADAAVYHEGGGSSKQVKVLTIRRTMRSMRVYFSRHLGKWTWLPLLFILSLDGVTHTLHALLTRRGAAATFRAYFMGWWDVLTFRSAAQ
ncbi:MAG: glycosyltransferase family 2 protein, partial [Pseudomonadales bacterium]|nr:glycosyltransferase family 2 protein [Pseudomonadales bacterium]